MMKLLIVYLVDNISNLCVIRGLVIEGGYKHSHKPSALSACLAYRQNCSAFMTVNC